MGVRVADIVLDIPTRALDSTFTYVVPEGMDARVGQCVEVDFSHRPSIGYIVNTSERPDGVLGGISLLPVKRVLTEPYFDLVHAELARWIAHEYLSTLTQAHALARERARAVRPLEQRYAKLPFQVGNLARKRWLRHTQHVCRLGHVFLARHREEVAQRPQFQVRYPSFRNNSEYVYPSS